MLVFHPEKKSNGVVIRILKNIEFMLWKDTDLCLVLGTQKHNNTTL